MAGGYDVGSGVLSVADESIATVLNEFGQFETRITSPTGDTGVVGAVSTMSDDRSSDETEIASRLFAGVPGAEHADVVGYYLGLYAGYVREGDFRANGSSGGFATWILGELLSKGLVDGVIHVSEDWQSDGLLFRYVVSRSVTQVQERAKSRYYPAELSDVLREVREKPGRYVVVGIPSIISEIHLLAENDPIFGQRIAFTVGLVCGHQKSTKYVENFAWQSGIKPGNLRGFNFRVKRSDGPAWDYQMEMRGLVDGDMVTLKRSQSELFGSDWGHGFFKAKFSDFTDDALNETASVSIGDAWLPQYDADSLGNNVIIVRDPQIQRIVEEAMENGRLCLDPVSAETVLRSQRGLIHHTRDELPYRLKRATRRDGWSPTRRVAQDADPLGLLRRLVQRSRTQMARMSHIHYQKALELDDWSYFHRRMARHVRWYKFLYRLVALQKLARRDGKAAVLKKVVRKAAGSRDDR